MFLHVVVSEVIYDLFKIYCFIKNRRLFPHKYYHIALFFFQNMTFLLFIPENNVRILFPMNIKFHPYFPTNIKIKIENPMKLIYIGLLFLSKPTVLGFLIEIDSGFCSFGSFKFWNVGLGFCSAPDLCLVWNYFVLV